MVYAEDRESRACSSFGTGPSCRNHYEAAGPCVWREAARICEPDADCTMIMDPAPPQPPPPPPYPPKPPPARSSPPPANLRVSPPPPRLCLGSIHGAQDDGGLEECEESFCNKVTDACTWCLCAACSRCPPRPAAAPSPPLNRFVEASDIYLFRGRPFIFMGANLWYAMHLACDNCASGNRERLIRELDSLAAMGVTSVRVLASGEGSGDGGAQASALRQWTVLPALQPEAGEYNRHLLVGLDFVLQELGRRGMMAVMVLNNAWPWSGGMGQYLDWAEDNPPPTPRRKEFTNIESWQHAGYFHRANEFFDSTRAIELSHNHIKYLLARRNSFTGRFYAADPTIMAWQLAHEPRPLDSGPREAYLEWITLTSELIKELAPHHMVSIGSEGAHAKRAEEMVSLASTKPGWTPWAVDTAEFEEEHAIKNIDYATVHLWPSQWGFTQKTQQQTWIARTKQYLEAHMDAAVRLGKPLVIEEVGMPRDGDSYLETSPARDRNTLFSSIFALAYTSMAERGAIAGVSFSGWSGEGRKQHGLWEEGDPLIAEPPSEFQGWNSIYDTDASTIEVVTSYAHRFAHIMPTLGLDT